jgi:hypothetical protein
MEFLAQVPLAESGISKEVDRDELNNFVSSIAEDLVEIMDTAYRIIAMYRYRVQYPNELEEMLPTIKVPEKFDILSAKFLEEELKAHKDSKSNPLIINQLEVEYATKKFYAGEVVDLLKLQLELDPLPNITEEDKTLRLSNKGITIVDYVISSNIHSFIVRAMRENENFIDLDMDKQMEILEKFAKEVTDANSAAQEVLNSALAPDDDEEAATGEGGKLQPGQKGKVEPIVEQ